MPNPRAQKPLTLDQVKKDLLSLKEPATALADMTAGGFRGLAQGTIGMPGEIESLGRAAINLGLASSPKNKKYIDKGVKPPQISEESALPNMEDAERYMTNLFGPVIPKGADQSRNAMVDYGRTFGQLGVLPGTSGAVKLATYGAGRGAGALTRAGLEQINKAHLFGEGPLAPFTPQAKSVVKTGGGNWDRGDIDRNLASMHKGMRWNQSAWELLPPERRAQNPQGLELAKARDEAYDVVADWSDKQLMKYILNQMGTKDDPVRKLGEQNISHLGMRPDDMGEFPYIIPTDETRKLRAEYKASTGEDSPLAESSLAANWENKADNAIGKTTVGEVMNAPNLPYQQIAKNAIASYANKVPPETPIYSVKNFGEHMQPIERSLGFRRLKNIMRDDIAAGRLDPQEVAKWDMEQAVRYVDKRDKATWKAEAEEADRLAKEFARYFPTLKEYPDKSRWIELKVPDLNSLPKEERMQLIDKLRKEAIEKDIDPEQYIEDYPRMKLEEALAHEGEKMGHCVGTYCEDVVTGKSRVISYRDANGDSHVTLEITPPSIEDYAAANQSTPYRPAQDKIMQIKGKGDARPVERYIPYVQDFQRSTKYPIEGDFGNSGFEYPVGEIFDEGQVKSLREAGHEVHDYLTKAEKDDLVRKLYEKDTGKNFDTGEPLNPPEDGMKAGGAVHISDNPDTMAMELQDQHYGVRMKDGGDPPVGFFNPNIAKQGKKARANAAKRSNEATASQDPRTYGAVQGLFQEDPRDSNPLSVFDPKRKQVTEAQDLTYPVGMALNMIPGLSLLKTPATKLGMKAERALQKPVTDIMNRGGFGAEMLGSFNTPPAQVVKPKGGNWLSGSVEKAVEPLRSKVTTENFVNYTPEQVQQMVGSDRIKRNDAINQWIDRNLTNYVKKEMATPEDPVRKLAEQGISHLPESTPMPRNMSSVWATREEAGFPQSMGTSRQAQVWEALADKPVGFGTVGEMINTGKGEPWMEKADPFTRVHGIAPMESSNMATDLGFDHIIDVLRQDVAEGRIRPDQLNKVSMEQAVRRTYEFDQEMAKKMAEAQIKATEGMPVHKEYPEEGYKWIELTLPKNMKLPEGYRLESDPAMWGERQGGYRLYDPSGKSVSYGKTEEEAISSGLGEKALKEALKYEGDTMGHCVGGYCPDVLRGRSRIYSLRDKRGEPHVTVEVNPPDMEAFIKSLPAYERYKIGESVRKKHFGAKVPPEKEKEYEDLFDQAIKYKYGEPKPTIRQIKGKQNAEPKADYLPYVQDFVKSGQWADVGDLRNTGLMDVESFLNPTTREKYLEHKLGIPKYATEKELDELHNEYLRLAEPQNYKPPEGEGMKAGGKVHVSDNCDCMQMELDNKKFAMGGAVMNPSDVGSPSPQNSASPVASFQAGGAVKGLAAVKQALAGGKKAATAVKPSLVIKSQPSLIVSNLIDEEPNIAKRLGAEARAKRQKAIEAEGKRQEAAKQTQPSVGYRPSTPQKPDPLVGTRFVNEPAFGLNPNDPFDITKYKGGSGMVLPWDSQSRNVKTTQVSGVDLPNQVFDVTHGGIPYAFDTQHVAKGIAGASGEDISKRIKTRADTAVRENKDRGGTGELLHFPITMGYRAEDYALPYSEFSFDIINHKLMTGELTKREADELSEMVRNFSPPKYKGKKPFAEFAGFTEPEGLNQIYTGEGLKVPSGELRKAIADRIIWQKGSQEKLGFNAEDLMNATTYEPLRGVDKGFIGSTVMRNTPTGMRLSPSAGKYPYDTDFSGEHLGRLDDLVDVEALFHRTLNPIKHELITRENLKPYNKESLRNAAIGAIEKRNEGISQPIDQQFLDDYNDYINELKKPHEYRVGGSVKAKKKYSDGGAISALMKHAETAGQSARMNNQRM